jgi:hypothetical protein
MAENSSPQTSTETLKETLDNLTFKNTQAETIGKMQNNTSRVKDNVGRKQPKAYGRIEGLKALAGLKDRWKQEPKRVGAQVTPY